MLLSLGLLPGQFSIDAPFCVAAGIQGLQPGQAAGDQHVHLHVAVPRYAHALASTLCVLQVVLPPVATGGLPKLSVCDLLKLVSWPCALHLALERAVTGRNATFTMYYTTLSLFNAEFGGPNCRTLTSRQQRLLQELAEEEERIASGEADGASAASG